MHVDQIEGKWTPIKRHLQEANGDLSDDDIEEVKGDRALMDGKLQERLGKSKQEVRDTVDKILAKV